MEAVEPNILERRGGRDDGQDAVRDDCGLDASRILVVERFERLRRSTAEEGNNFILAWNRKQNES